MLEFEKLAPEYATALLLALLPQFSDFARSLDLPVLTPIASNHVQEYVCDPRKGRVGGWITLTNGARFWFANGVVDRFESPQCYYVLQEPKDIPKFYGVLSLNKTQAIEAARAKLVKLGYKLEKILADQEPEVRMPPRIGTNVVPRFRVQWLDPLEQMVGIDVEVNGTTGAIELLSLPSSLFWRDPPMPPRTPDPLNPSRGGSQLSSNVLVAAALPKCSAFAERLKLPVPLPLTANHVASAGMGDRGWQLRLKLTNEYSFIYDGGFVRGFIAPNSFYGRQPGERRPIDDYLGVWNLDESQALALARDAIRQAGYVTSEFKADKKPTVQKPKQVGRFRIARYLFTWEVSSATEPLVTAAEARVEIDAQSGSVKYLYLFTARLWEEQPLSDQPKHLPVKK